MSIPVPTAIFTADAYALEFGQETVLHWAISGLSPESVTIVATVGQSTQWVSNGGPQQTSLVVQPTQTTTYTLMATDPIGQQVTAQVTIVLPPIIFAFTADSLLLTSGNTTTLRWSTADATSISIDQGVGSVGAVGSALLFFTLIFVTAAHAAASLAKANAEMANIEAGVRHSAKIVKRLDTGTDRGGELAGYVCAGRLIKLVAEIGLSRRDVVDEFFYSHGRLILVKETVRTYSSNAKTGVPDLSNVEDTSTMLDYFHDGRMVCRRCPKELAGHSLSSNEFAKTERSLLDESTMFRNAIQSGMKTIDIVAWIKG